MRQSSLVPLLILSLTLFGWGCAKTAPSSSSTNASNPTGLQKGQTKFPTYVSEVKVLTPKDELNQILQNYAATKSFRAKVKSTTSKGEINGVMEFAKPNRFHGMIQNSPTLSTELIIVEDDLYIKTTGGSWVDLSQSKGSKTLGETMRNALSGDDGLQKLVLDESSTVDKKDDAARACTLYTVHLTDKDGSHDVKICVNNGLPKFVDSAKKDLTTAIEYYDYNAVFTIARPM